MFEIIELESQSKKSERIEITTIFPLKSKESQSLESQSLEWKLRITKLEFTNLGITKQEAGASQLSARLG